MRLTEEQIQRYSRHVLLSDVGGVGQTRLLSATVHVPVGAGREANVVALAYLAAAGVGRIVLTGDAGGVVTDVELPGSILYAADDVGRPRAEAIARRVAELNPDVKVTVADDDESPHRVDAGRAKDPCDALIVGGAAALETISRIARPA